MRAIGIAVAVAVCLGIGAADALAYDAGAEASNYSKIHERFLHDYGTSSDYQIAEHLGGLSGWIEQADIVLRDPQRSPISLCAEHYDGCMGDLRMQDWGDKGLGVVAAVQFVTRNGATISGHVWASFPRDGKATGRKPAIDITNGSVQAPEELYWHDAQVLAQHGYVVLTWDPQGQGRSDALGAGSNIFRGVPAQQAPNFYEGTEEALDFLLSTPSHPYEPRGVDGASNADAKAKQDARVQAGYANAYNPFHGLIDPDRVGIAGHSLGAGAVSSVGSTDHRVDAIVAWDNLSAGEGAEAPRVPALGISNDYGLTPQPFTADPDARAKLKAFDAYRKAGIDTAEMVIRGGTHYESSYIPNPAFGATLRGMDLVDWYTLAWFDRYVKGDDDATDRILSDRWRSDAAEAGVDPNGDGNLFSFYYRSVISIKRGKKDTPYLCEDVRAGCGGTLVPKAQDGFPGEFSYLTERRPKG